MSWDYGGGTSSDGDGDDWGAGPSQPGSSNAPVSPAVLGFGQAPRAGADTQAPPTRLLMVGLVLAAASIVIGLGSDSATLASVGWLLGGPLAIGSLAFFLQIDTRRRSEPWYAETSLTPWLRRGVVLLALLAVALNAWTIASSVARGTWS